MSLETIQQDIEALPPDAQQIVLDLVQLLKQQYRPAALDLSNQNQDPVRASSDLSHDWSDFIGCMEAEPDLATHYKAYLRDELDKQ